MDESQDTTATQTLPFRLRGRVQPLQALEIANLAPPSLQSALTALPAADGCIHVHGALRDAAKAGLADQAVPIFMRKSSKAAASARRPLARRRIAEGWPRFGPLA